MSRSRIFTSIFKKKDYILESVRQTAQVSRFSSLPPQCTSDIPPLTSSYSTNVNAKVEEEWSNGPDQVLPATSHKMWLPSSTVQLQMTPSGNESLPPQSVYSLLKESSEKYWSNNALAVMEHGEWRFRTFEDYYVESCLAAKSFISLGLDRYRGVCLMGHNSPEWFIANFGAMFAGGISSGISPNSSLSNTLHVATDSNAQFAVVDTPANADKLLSIRHKLPNLKTIIQYRGESKSPDVMSWDEFLSVGASQSDGPLNSILSTMGVNECCTIIYTSGTTSKPKGVMCSHDNLTWSGKMHSKSFDLPEGENTISYLPLNHVAAQVLDIYVGCAVGGTLYFGDEKALKGTLINTLKDVQPTGLLTVPRILEKMHEKINETLSTRSSMEKRLFGWASAQGYNYHSSVNAGRSISTSELLQYRLAKRLVLNKIKPNLGMSNTAYLVTGSGPVKEEVLDFFAGLDLPVANIYGMSETSSLGTMGYESFGTRRPNSVGKSILDLRCKVAPLAGHEKEGEVCFKGRSVFMGYLNDESKTHETIQDDGWMRTGDMGYMDSSGFLFITGRLKELIITAGGENIAPLPIEEDIARHLPIAANVMVLGDAKKFLSVFISLKVEKDLETETPLDDLLPSVKTWLAERGSSSSTVSEVIEEVDSEPHGEVAMAIQEAVDSYNNTLAQSNVHQIKKWRLLPNEFSVATGELTQTLKLKRSAVSTKYQHLIDSIYHHDTSC